MSSRGYEVDLIESICENIALAGHLEEISKDEDESAKEILKKALTLRREQMSRLLEMADMPNPKYHCAVKHTLGAWWRQQEVYEATLEDEDYRLAQELGDLSAMCLSKYLGMEFEVCQRCLFDRMLVKQVEKEHSAILKTNDKGDETNG